MMEMLSCLWIRMIEMVRGVFIDGCILVKCVSDLNIAIHSTILGLSSSQEYLVDS